VIDNNKNMSIYRAIFRNSLKITWRNKYLWFFGIFAAFGLKLFFEVIKENFKGRSAKIILTILAILILVYPLSFNFDLLFNPEKS